MESSELLLEWYWLCNLKKIFLLLLRQNREPVPVEEPALAI